MADETPDARMETVQGGSAAQRDRWTIPREVSDDVVYQLAVPVQRARPT